MFFKVSLSDNKRKENKSQSKKSISSNSGLAKKKTSSKKNQHLEIEGEIDIERGLLNLKN